MAKGWLEIDPGWIASMFGLKATGQMRLDLMKFRVQVDNEDIGQDEVVEGTFQMVTGRMIFPTGWRRKANRR